MEKNRTRKRMITLAIVAVVIALGYTLGPLAFEMILAMHGM